MSRSLSTKGRTDGVPEGLIFGPENKCDAKCPARAITTVLLSTGTLRFCGHHFFSLEIPEELIIDFSLEEDPGFDSRFFGSLDETPDATPEDGTPELV